MGLRRRSREIALQILFQSEFASTLSAEQALHLYLDNFEAPVDVKEYAEQVVNGIWKHRPEIDRLIQAHSQNWKVTRLSFVDKNILRIAIYELKYMNGEIPTNVVFDEAIEIGKRYGSQDSSAFINGVLDNIVKGLHE